MSLSYQNLVRHYRQIDLPKGETRSDWLQRPLSDSQLDYAALDVLYLPEIASEQQSQLEEAGKAGWANEEFERLQHSYESEFTKDYSDYYQGMKGAWQLRKRNLLALRELCIWREKRSRERDRPRNWILRDNVLIEIARRLPENKSALSGIKDISQNFLRFEGSRVLPVIETVLSADSSEFPPDISGPLGADMKKKLKIARDCVSRVAEFHQIPTEYLGRRKSMVLYIKHLEGGELPPEFNGWRGEVLLPELDSLFSDKSGDSSGNDKDTEQIGA
jgi:ribonuclease D